MHYCIDGKIKRYESLLCSCGPFGHGIDFDPVIELNALRAEVGRLRERDDRLIKQFRSQLMDIISRIGVARLPIEIRSELQQLHDSMNVWILQEQPHAN